MKNINLFFLIIILTTVNSFGVKCNNAKERDNDEKKTIPRHYSINIQDVISKTGKGTFFKDSN